jgi:hypothetical protein
MTVKKRKNIEDENECLPRKSKKNKDDECAPRKSKKVKLKYTLEKLKKEIKENECIDKFNLITQNNKFLEKELFIDKVFKEIENNESSDIEKYSYILNFITNNGESSRKIGEIEIDPILIKTQIRFFLLQNIDDDTDIDNIKKNFLEKNILKVIILLDETIELRNDNFPFTNHSININWTINEKWKREKLNKYYWGYQIIKLPLFINNFGFKNSEEKIIKYNNGIINCDLKAEMEFGLNKIKDQVMDMFKEFGKDCQKN